MIRARALALALMVALAAGLRFATLDLQSYWFDEAFTVRAVSEGFGHLVDQLPETEFTPPLYYALAWLWGKLFGLGEVGLRSLSALLGTATVVVVYVAGSRLVNARTGLAAAALFAVQPLSIWYSQEARSYALLSLLSALTLMFLAFELRAPGERRAIIGWAISAALALATHYFAVFLVLPQAVWLLARRRDTSVLVAVAGVGAVGLALLPLAIEQRGEALLGVIEDRPLWNRVRVTLTHLPGGRFSDYAGRFPVEGLLYALGLLLVGLTARRMDLPSRRGVALAFGLSAAATAVPLGAAVLGFDYVVDRNFIYVLPALTILVAAGLVNRPAGLLGAGTLAAILVLSVAAVFRWSGDPVVQRSDWRAAAEMLGPPDPSRALLLDWDGLPTLHLYRDTSELPAGGAPVDEVIQILRPAALSPPPPPAFTQVGQEEIGHLVLARYRAPRPQPLPRERLARPVSNGYGGHAILDTPGPDE